MPKAVFKRLMGVELPQQQIKKGIKFLKQQTCGGIAQLGERAARTVAYASKQELEQAISRRCHTQQTENDTPPAPPKAPVARDGVSYTQSRRTGREPPPPVVVRTDGGQE